MHGFRDLTPGALSCWLRQQELDAATGLARDPFECPLACFLQAFGAHQPEVMLDHISFLYKGETFSIPTPAWASAFIREIDTLPDSGLWLISAHLAIQALDSVFPARVA